MATTLLSLVTSIDKIVRNNQIDSPDITDRINEAIFAIAGGIVLPDNRISPPLPDLYTSASVATATDAAYVSLPSTYQRNVFNIIDANGRSVEPLQGGDYYSFDLFLNSIPYQDLSGTGIINFVAIKGSNLYYQGIPAESENMTVHFYRKPVDIDDNNAVPDGIPAQYSKPLIVHYVCREIFGDVLEGNIKGRFNYHSERFYKTLTDMTDFIGNSDGEGIYFIPSGEI